MVIFTLRVEELAALPRAWCTGPPRSALSAAASLSGGRAVDAKQIDIECDVVFCRSCAWLNRELQELHVALAHGNKSAQVEIDARVFMCAAADSGWTRRCPSIPLTWLMTSPMDTIQYHRLPDLIQFMTCGGAAVCPRGSELGNMAGGGGSHASARGEGVYRSKSVALMRMLVNSAVPTLRKGRFLQNPLSSAHPLIDDCHDPMVFVSIINVMHGTLLGLYPTCAKQPVFAVRVLLMVQLRALATATLATQQRFLKSLPNLIKLCLMEYVVNVVQDFCVHGSELGRLGACSDDVHTLRSNSSYLTICQTVCDCLRMDSLQNNSWSWAVLEKHAVMLIERFTRTCKMRITSGTAHHRDHLMTRGSEVDVSAATRAASARCMPSTVAESFSIPMSTGARNRHRGILTMWRKDVASESVSSDLNRVIVQAAMSSPVSSSADGALRLTLKQTLIDIGAPAHLQPETVVSGMNALSAVVEAFQSHVTCFTLPRNLVATDCRVLYDRLGMEPWHMCLHGRVHVCMWCLQRMSQNPLQHKLRLDVMKNELSCSVCSVMPVVSISVVGRLLRIGNAYYYLCVDCNQIQPWLGTGSEFVHSGHCLHSRAKSSSSKASASSNSSALQHENWVVPTLMTQARPGDARQRGRVHGHGILTSTAVISDTGLVRSKRNMCLVCERRQSSQRVLLLHIPWRRHVVVTLCVRHRIADHLARFVFDTHTLRVILRESCAATQSRARGCERRRARWKDV